ncbi:uncharacterized tRNA/rRNA methyltransferase Rv0881/MT0904 [Arthrobacter sp. Hiyo8]|nr:uncharacterized tRNA/rRNA methyltransferase Rv0881/MT0904 [Arthrobacter sp. Hiyo8]
MTFHYLETADDPRVADYTQLTDVHLRKLREPAEGMYIAESSRVLRRALAAGTNPVPSSWRRNGWKTSTTSSNSSRRSRSTSAKLRCLRKSLDSTCTAVPWRPCIARTGALEELLADCVRARGRSRIAVLEDLTDHTNVGAVFRSAAAIGVDAVLVSPQCADPLYRRSIRVSMGTVFQVPWTRVDPWPASIEQLKEAGYFVAGMSLGEGAITLDELVAQDHQNLVLVFGTEGDGLKPETDQLLDARVTIPMMNGVDSLNVAASSAVAFYATR